MWRLLKQIRNISDSVLCRFDSNGYAVKTYFFEFSNSAILATVDLAIQIIKNLSKHMEKIGEKVILRLLVSFIEFSAGSRVIKKIWRNCLGYEPARQPVCQRTDRIFEHTWRVDVNRQR